MPHKLCVGTHPPFLCARAQVNNGVAKPSPNWAKKETKLAVDQNRTPDLRWSPDGNLPQLPPPVEPPQDSIETSEQHAQQEAAPEATAPLCAAAAATHRPPPTSMRPMSNLRQPPPACPTVHEEQEWTEEPQEEVTYPRPGFHVSGNLWNI